MEQFVLDAEPRNDFGRRATRDIRSRGLIPAIIYGHKEATVHVSLDLKAFTKFLDAGHRIVTLRVGSKDESSVVKEVQYDSLGTTLIHADFTRIRRDEKIQMAVPIETIGVAKGLSTGGVLAFPMKEVPVEGFPQDIPEHISLNIEALELGQAIRLKDLAVPANCRFVGNPEQVIITVVHHKVEAAPVPVEGAPVLPEVIGKKKPEEGEEGAAPAEGDAKKKEKEKEGKDKEK